MTLESTLRLDARHLFKVPQATPVAIRCVEGSLWLTLDNDPRDIVLEPGDAFEAPAHRQCLLYALEPARFTLQPGAAAAQARPELAEAA